MKYIQLHMLLTTYINRQHWYNTNIINVYHLLLAFFMKLCVGNVTLTKLSNKTRFHTNMLNYKYKMPTCILTS